jgi:hypothetical protein
MTISNVFGPILLVGCFGAAKSVPGQNAKNSERAEDFRFTPESGKTTTAPSLTLQI